MAKIRPQHWPIRTRIALLIAAITGALLIFMALSVYGVFAQQLAANLDDTLTLRGEANRNLVDLTASPPSLRVTRDPNQELTTGEAVLRLYRSDGTVIDDASPASGATSEERAVVLRAAATERDAYQTIDLAYDEDYRVLVSPLRTSSGDLILLVTGLEQSRVDAPLRILRYVLLVAVPITDVGSGLGGFWVAERALRPVSAMIVTAQRITRGDLTQRVPGDEATDELGHLARTLNSMITRLEETVERERRFTADAAHELRTPLAAIEAGIDVTLVADRPSTEYRRVLEVVRGQTRRLGRLANQLLLLSRLDAHEVQADFQPVDLQDLLEATSDAFAASHPSATVTFTSTAAPAIVRGDLDLLARAIMNLLENAVAHAGATVTIALQLRRLDTRVEIEIEDNGPGIPPELAVGVFGRFRRGSAARSGVGTGLGLSIVHAIVRSHGGTIDLVPSAGAHFRIALPVLDAIPERQTPRDR